MLQPDNSFVTVCAIATLFMHKPRQALRARNYQLSEMLGGALRARGKKIIKRTTEE